MTAVKTSVTKPTRRDRARATRLRITKAAYSLFCERGYSGTTMADVAEASGVAVQTVYLVFHTKSELLSRTYDFAVLGEEDPLPPELQPWNAQMTSEADVTDALRHAVVGIGTILARATPLDTVVRAGAGSDPDAARSERCTNGGEPRDTGRCSRCFEQRPACVSASLRSARRSCCSSTSEWTSTACSFLTSAGPTTTGSNWTVATVSEQVFETVRPD